MLYPIELWVRCTRDSSRLAPQNRQLYRHSKWLAIQNRRREWLFFSHGPSSFDGCLRAPPPGQRRSLRGDVAHQNRQQDRQRTGSPTSLDKIRQSVIVPNGKHAPAVITRGANMKLFGITGGIAMGKSTAGELLQRRGVPVADTDVLARRVVEPGQPAQAEIRARFGPAILLPDGTLDRAHLAQCVFSDPAARADLESILHPRIRVLWMAEVHNWRVAGHACAAVIIPLLFETNAQSLFDHTLCVACGEATQALRLRHRGWDEAHCRRRIQAQWPVEQKIAQSDFLVWTDTTLEAHAAQLLKIIPAKN